MMQDFYFLKIIRYTLGALINQKYWLRVFLGRLDYMQIPA